MTDYVKVKSGASLVIYRNGAVDISQGPLSYSLAPGTARIGVVGALRVLVDSDSPGGGVELSALEADALAHTYGFPVVELE